MQLKSGEIPTIAFTTPLFYPGAGFFTTAPGSSLSERWKKNRPARFLVAQPFLWARPMGKTWAKLISVPFLGPFFAHKASKSQLNHPKIEDDQT